MLLLLVEAVVLTVVASSNDVDVDRLKSSNDDHNHHHEEAVFTLEASVQATIILTIAVIIIVLNTLIITSFSNFRGTGNVLNIYILSLSIADLVCGLLVVPLSVYPALVRQWVYGDLMCRVVGYTESIVWIVSAYTLMWISVDRYIAIRKPLRYDTVQTKTRCQCWMAFTWISSAMMCSPPLLEYSPALFDKDSYICVLNWERMIAYSATLIILVLGPSLITIVYTYTYVFVIVRRLKQGDLSHDKEYVTALTEALANPNHTLSIILIVTFWILWIPFLAIKTYEQLSGHKITIPHLHFVIVWLGFSHSAWKAFILVTYSPQFRVMLRLLCITLCCRQRTAHDIELMNMEIED
ncbi:beta-2 adrenergic receptor [Planococcus citri]|uniref:beta-2 adrenergic receptor n=1 Tax=Planococcus citri TaxID=170843 RepID=UPI0031F8E5C7